MGDVTVVLKVPLPARVAGGVLELIEHAFDLGLSGERPARAPEGAQVVDGDAPQPATERPGPAVVDELRQPGDDHGEHLLDHVVDVVGLWQVAAHPGAEQRRIDLD